MWTKCSWVCRRLSGACVSQRSAGVRAQGRRRLDRNRCRSDRASRRGTHRSLGAQRVHQADRGVTGGPGSSIGRKARPEAIGRLCALRPLWVEGVGYCTMKTRISNSRVASDAEPEARNDTASCDERHRRWLPNCTARARQHVLLPERKPRPDPGLDGPDVRRPGAGGHRAEGPGLRRHRIEGRRPCKLRLRSHCPLQGCLCPGAGHPASDAQGSALSGWDRAGAPSLPVPRYVHGRPPALACAGGRPWCPERVRVRQPAVVVAIRRSKAANAASWRHWIRALALASRRRRHCCRGLSVPGLSWRQGPARR